jgi:hypothetical protein
MAKALYPWQPFIKQRVRRVFIANMDSSAKAENLRINHHVNDHQVLPSKRAAVFIFSPNDLNLPGSNFLADLLRQSINFASSAHQEDSGVQCTTWKTAASWLFPAIRSLPRHFKCNDECSLQVIFLCHGVDEHLIWSGGQRIRTVDVLMALDSLQFKQLDSVSLLACNSLKNVIIPRLSFDVIGFVDYIFWNELPFFSCRMMKEYCAGEDLKSAISMAKKSCKYSKITPFPKNSLIFRSSRRNL